MKKYVGPNASIISVLTEDIMSASWNLVDVTDTKSTYDMMIDVNEMWGG